MKKRNKLIQQNKTLADYLGMGILGALMAFALASAVVQYIDLDPWMSYSYMRIILSVLVTMSICMIMFRNWKTALIGGAVILLACAIIFIIWIRDGFSAEFYTGVNVYFGWLSSFILDWADSTKLPGINLYITIMGLSSAITVFIYFTIVRWFIYIPVFIMTVSLFVTQWIFAREVNKPAFYIAFSLLLIFYVISVFRSSRRRIYRKGEGQKFLSKSSLIAVAAPVVAVLIILVTLLPKSNEPIIWEWLDKKIKYRSESGDKTVDIETYDEFSVNQTGLLNEPGTPGGRVKLDYTHVLDVYGSESLYLRGESWPYFDGTSWGESSSTQDFTGPVVSYDEYDANKKMLLEPSYGWRFMEIDRWLSEEYDDFDGVVSLPGTDFDLAMGVELLPPWYELDNADVVYAGVRTRTLFVPLYSELESLRDINNPTAEFDDTLDAEKPVSLYTRLSFDYLSADFENEKFIEYLRKSERGIYSRLLSELLQIENNPGDYSNIILTGSFDSAIANLYDLNKLSEDIYWRYTAVPDELPDRVVELAGSITEQYDNDYDKVMALEQFFWQGFTYTLDAEFKPEGRDFTDWFVFDNKKGYCTFYATSMTTLARSIGMPARYVEGFLTPPKPVTGYNYYYVLNLNAHAWVEVYFEGVGWISFDPTPPLSERDSSTSTVSPTSRPDITDPDSEDPPIEPDDTEEPVIPTPDGNDTDISRGSDIPWGWIIPGIILGALILFNIMVTAGRKMLFGNIGNARRFTTGYLEILRILERRGFKFKKGMTLMELAYKVDDEYLIKKQSMKDVTSVFYRISYGGESPAKDELEVLEAYYNELRRVLNIELRWWERIIYRIIFPIL